MAIKTNFDPNAITAGINRKDELGDTADSFSTRNTVAEQGANKSLDRPSPSKTRFAGDRAFRALILGDPEQSNAQLDWMDEFTKGGSKIGINWKENYDMAMGVGPSDNIDKGQSNTMSSKPKSNTMSSEPTSADKKGIA